MKEICKCGECKKCRQRECMQKLRHKRKNYQKDIDIMESMFDEGAFYPISSLNPYVIHYINNKYVEDAPF